MQVIPGAKPLVEYQRKFRVNVNVPTPNEAPSMAVVRDVWTKIVGAVSKINKDDPGVKEWLKETKRGWVEPPLKVPITLMTPN